MAAWLLAAGSAWGQVAVNQILFPVNIGRTLDATVDVDYTRTSAAAAVVQVPIPPQLGIAPPALPAGCTAIVLGGNPAVECTVPPGGAGDAGTLSFQVRGTTLGSFSLVATGTGGSSASNTGTVRSSGDLTLLKTKSPAGNLLPGQSATFTLQPQVAAGADDLPPGNTITVTDQLPGTATDFTVSAINPGIASCTSVAVANGAARTVTCTYTGPLTVAALNAATITITGAPGTTGSFNNTGSIAAGVPGYFDRDPNNNIANAAYTVDAGGDVQALGSFPAGVQALGSAQTLNISWRNNGPTALPAGGTLSTTIPAGFTVNSLPAGCSGPATGVVLGAPAVLTCNAAAAAAGATQSFAIPLTMPATAQAGNFVVTAAPPAGFGDSVAANNSVTLPWQTVTPYADLRGAKSKVPASGPVPPGATITTTLTVTNDAASPAAATYSAAGGGTELRVVDYLKPTEIAGDALSGVSAGWQCTVSNDADPADPARSKRVACVRSAGGTLAPGASLSVSFSTTVAAVSGQVVLSDRICTGETLLTQLGLTPAQGPQPPGSGQTANDCAEAGTSLIATDVVSGQGGVTIRKESSIDGTAWVDPVAAAPTVAAAANSQFWRITITTPAGGAQQPIPTLVLSDALPGILNVASPGAPAPSYVTPAITVTTQVTAGAATGSCPSLAAGSGALSCTFTGVAPGTTLVVSYAVQRPFAAGTLTNTASLSSPDAILSGTLSDAAALVVEPRIDVAATTKTVTPATPRIGQTLQFTITTQNLGPEDVTGIGDFKIVDDLNTSVGGAAVAFGDIVAGGSGLSCAIATSVLPDEAALAAGHVRVRCTNTTPVARYATRTLTIGARVLKPAGLPNAGTVYAGQSNTARVDIPDSRCEFKTETSSNGNVSAACNDAASASNNERSVSFDVLVPQIDVQQRKTRVLPAGQTGFGVGQPLRYRFRLQNNGPSRAEGVTMTDQMTVPAGFTLASPQVFNVNGAAAEAGYALDTGKTGSVSCSQAAPNANLVCTLAPTPAASYLDAGYEVNFEVELVQTGSALLPVSFGNEALVCADESANYEIAGACARNVVNNNNVAAVNDVIFPRADLVLAKTTVTPSPVAIGQAVEYLLQVRNAGPSPTQQMRVSDLLPPDFELVTSGPQAPSLTLGSFVTAPPSTATGATLTCLPSPATLSTPGQQQTVSCVINATPGPLGAGAFPASNDAANTLLLRLFARPKSGLYAGPYGTDRINNASVSPGLAADGMPLAIDTVPGNNNASSVVQVARSSLRGRIFIDRNGNGQQDGTLPAQDEGIGNVGLTLTGVDLFGNAVTRTTTSDNTVGPTRGDYLFDHLPPGTYTVTETQPAGYGNSPGTPPPPTAGGTYAAAATAGSSTWSGITLPLGGQGINYHFPEGVPAPGISGKVFVDRADNGVLDADDPAIPGVMLGLYPAGTTCPAAGALPGGALQTVQTDAGGQYLFTGLTAGTSYVVCQQQPAGHADRPPLPGTNGSTPGANQIDIASLPSTGSAGNDFPEVLGRIGGTVFLDYFAGAPGSTNNGVQNAGEPGIGSAVPGAGVPVTLTGTPSAGPGAGVAITPRTTTTAADGSYSFPDLLPGSYTVTEGAIPLALGTYADGINTAGPVTSGTPGVAGAVGVNTIGNIVLSAAGASSSGNNFAELPRTAIWGLVFVDANQDGLLTTVDPQRLPGVVIELRQGGSSCANATLLGTTITASNGSYVFPGGTVTVGQVVAGQSYRVCQQQPADFVNGPTLPGVNGTSALPNEILVGNLPLTGSGSNNFGEWAQLVTPPSVPAISGTVFIDRNRDGNFTVVDEGRIGGVTVRLVDGIGCSGTELARTQTTSDGRYGFSLAALVAGRAYSVCETQPADYADGPTRPGAGNTSPAPDHIVIGSLPAAGSADNDFGEWAGRITGRVYLDRDDNGQFNGADSGIGGVVVTLTRDGQSFTRSALTLSDGRFVFEDLPGGNWTLTEQAAQPTVTIDNVTQTTSDGRTTAGSGGGTVTAPGSTPSRIGGLTLPVGGEAVDNLFGEVVAASIAGRVWLDDNANGLIDGGEAGIAGVTLVLTGTDDQGHGVNLSQVTGADGRYEFVNLRPGTYTVTEPTQPGSTRNSATVPGSTGGSATANDVYPSAIGGIPLLAGQRSAGNDFGETNAMPDLVVTKATREARFVAGRLGHYLISVRNADVGPTQGSVTVSDRLPAGLTLAAVPTGSGWTCSGAVGAGSFSCSSSAPLAGGANAPVIELAVNVAASAAGGSPVSNAVLVQGGGEPAARAPTSDERGRFDGSPTTLPLCAQPAQHNACRVATEVVLPAALSGSVWLETGGTPRQLDGGDRPLPGWIVELVNPNTGQVIATQTTGPDGRYRFTDLEPGVPYGVRFRDPASGVVYAGPVNGEAGVPAAPCSSSAPPSSCGAGPREPMLTVVLAPGQELTQQSLPVDPSGVVYDSLSREPVPGAVVSFAPSGVCAGYDPATQVAGAGLGGYTISGQAISMTTGADGFYRFVLLPSAPAQCRFSLTVTPPPQWTSPSTLIPAQPGALAPAGGAGTVVAVQPQPGAPSVEPGPGTNYYLLLDVGSATPEIVHNHLPVDAALPAGLALRKTGDKAVAEVGDSVRYSITVSVSPGASPRQVTVVDRLPHGFTYIAGTAMLDGRRIADPAGAPGPQLAFQLGSVPAGGSVTLQYRVRVGIGAAQGDGINTAIAHGCQVSGGCVSAGFTPLPRSLPSNEGRYRVRVAGGAFGIEACVLGKVFVDCNGNHVQDPEELGIPGVRLVLQDGTFLTSDSEGKYSMCGLPPKSHVLRIDELTLPRGSRLTTSSNRNLGDAGSLWLDLKMGELQRADFIEGSCSNPMLDQVKARRAQGEVAVPEVEKKNRPALRFDSKAHGLTPLTTPAQGTDSADQPVPRTRPAADPREGK
ncbi:MAG: SdrD B-like domain-containing protein [Rubrivivax sp.]